MLCINKNSREYQTLKKLSGLSDFVLSAYVGDFLETHNRFPYLDELPKADSSKAISEDLSLKKDNTTKTENILLATNTNTVEEAVPVLNNKYRDKEIEVLEVGSRSKVYITTRPNTTQNQNGETDRLIKIATEMADIKERALANGTFMLAPNGRQTYLTEQLWLQVRTQEFKDWFGDWINDPANASKVVDENGEPLVVYHGGKSNFNIFETKIQTHTTKIGLSREEAEKEALKLFTNDEIKIIKNKSNEDPFAKLIEDPFGDTKNEDDILYDKFLAEAQRIYKDSIKEVPQYRIGSFFTTDLKYAETYGKFNYPVFLNIKNPDYSDYIHSMYTSELQINRLKKEGYDGIYGHDVKGRDVESNGIEYVVFNPNQIKSATDNNGEFSSSNDNINDDYENVNSFAFFNEIIDKLQTLYGISIIPITNAELSQDRWASITGTKGVKSFIYNGNIYINIDIATVDSPVHEFLHLLFGSMKYLNRALYDLLVGQAEQFDSYNTISLNYPNRTKGDINEEVFVTELAKYLTGLKNAISNLEQSVQNEIIYNVNRTLDTVLMGENSVKCVENPYIMNLKTLAKLVNSSTMISEKRGSLSDATLNRMMANTKSELMKNKELKEECR